jgi:hypothetical protein
VAFLSREKNRNKKLKYNLMLKRQEAHDKSTFAAIEFYAKAIYHSS